jgi:hypothetical protein
LFLAIIPINYLEQSPNLSVNALLFKPFEGKCISFLQHNYCDYPSKGILRGVSSLLHLEFKNAYNYNPISFLVVLSMFSIVIGDIFMILKTRKSNLEIIRK